MPKQVLILDPPESKLTRLLEAVSTCVGHPVVQVVSSLKDLLRSLTEDGPYDLLILDYDLGDGERPGIDLLPTIRGVDAVLPIVVVATHGDVDTVANAVERGASDFLVRGDRLQERITTLLAKFRNVAELMKENRTLRRRTASLERAERARYRIVGRSPQIKELVDRSQRVATVPRPVLILGERGTGKELIARLIHDVGHPGMPFVVVNCAALPDTLLESELFGHEKGAFTGASDAAEGKFEQASGGTLFLDEIGNMSLAFQQKILRVVEYGVFTRVGGRLERKVSTRIVAATNAELKDRIEAGLFLPDLYDRLAFEVIRVPPLRQRDGEIEVLSQHFLDQFMQEVPILQGKRLAQEAIEALKEYPFPGNVRELKNIIERAVYRDTTNELTLEDLGLEIEEATRPAQGSFKEQVGTFEKELLQEALQKADGNQAEAARLLGLSYHQLRYFVRKHKASVAKRSASKEKTGER